MALLLRHLGSLPLVGSFGYLAAVYSIHSFMSHRQPVTIPRPVLVVYNAAQVVVNAYVAYKIAQPLGGHVWGIGLKDTPAVRYGVYLHMLCKYLDFNDTLIILLRKKSEQLSFLHLWHHATILLVWGWVVSTWPTAEEDGSAAYAYGAWINSIVHVVMYFYYGLTAMGYKPPFKKAVTMVQLTQFASCITMAIAALFLDVTPVFYNAVQVMYHIGMLKLFLPLLMGKKKKEGMSTNVPRTPAEEEVTRSKSD